MWAGRPCSLTMHYIYSKTQVAGDNIWLAAGGSQSGLIHTCRCQSSKVFGVSSSWSRLSALPCFIKVVNSRSQMPIWRGGKRGGGYQKFHSVLGQQDQQCNTIL